MKKMKRIMKIMNPKMMILMIMIHKTMKKDLSVHNSSNPLNLETLLNLF